MPKQALKKKHSHLQDGFCDLTGEELPSETKLFDTHRPVAKKDGGIYDDENTTVVLPLPHQEEHETRRIRPPKLAAMKTKIDGREQISKICCSYTNRLDADRRRVDKLEPETIEWLKDSGKTVGAKLRQVDKELTKMLKDYDHPLIEPALNVRGIGPVSIAYWLVYVEIHKAKHASSIWKYAGVHVPAIERYEKGKAGGGNKRLRTMFYTTALSQMQGRGPYRHFYDNVKGRLEISEKLVQSRNTQGFLKEMMWKDTKPCHRHGAALRAIMKHLFNDFWYVDRELAGLETSMGYAEAQLGKGHGTINPTENGWIW
jgi:hypothetical protein